MKIIYENPPAHIWERIKKTVVVDEERFMLTYGDAIYNPAQLEVDQFVLAHEKRHMEQQAAHPGGPDGWWDQWITDPAFRAEHEAQGYGAQYAHYCTMRKDRNIRARYMHEIAKALASGMYGLKIAAVDARTAILKRAGQ